jgi:hypothetical protein
MQKRFKDVIVISSADVLKCITQSADDVIKSNCLYNLLKERKFTAHTNSI